MKRFERSWQPIRCATRRAEIEAASLVVAEQLGTRGVVEYSAEMLVRNHNLQGGTFWRPWSLASGYPGIAVALHYIGIIHGDHRFLNVSRQMVDLAIASIPLAKVLSPSFLEGLSGICFAARFVDPVKYRRTLSFLETVLLDATLQLCSRIDNADGVYVSEFDTVSGLAGIGRYWLMAVQDQEDIASTKVAESNNHVGLTACLNSLCALVSGNSSKFYRWHTPPHKITDPVLKEEFLDGFLNLGLAHGLPAIIALLAADTARGLNDERIAALTGAASWLASQCVQEEQGICWPRVVPLTPRSTPSANYRPSWCYGTPGIAWTLFEAGRVVNNEAWRELAKSSMRDIFSRDVESWFLPSPTFCHGLAGLLHVTQCFASQAATDSELREWHSYMETLCGLVMESFAPSAALAFRDVEPDEELIERPGLLDGAAGVAAVLASASHSTAPRWNAAFLLS